MRNLLTILLIVRCYLALAESGSAVLVVLGGGLDSGGMPHETVMRRIRRAANIYKEQSRTGGLLFCSSPYHWPANIADMYLKQKRIKTTSAGSGVESGICMYPKWLSYDTSASAKSLL